MRYTIKAGKHYDTRLFSSWPHVGRTRMAYQVAFDATCRYELPAYNSLDVNKLFGLSFGLFAVHQESARYGWRYNKEKDCVDLLAYCYVDGKRQQDVMGNFSIVAQVPIGKTVSCYLVVTTEYYQFTVSDGLKKDVVTVPHGKLPGYGMTHSLYFGGSLPAPHDMHVDMKPL
jgi:hypothetical protein